VLFMASLLSPLRDAITNRQGTPFRDAQSSVVSMLSPFRDAMANRQGVKRQRLSPFIPSSPCSKRRAIDTASPQALREEDSKVASILGFKACLPRRSSSSEPKVRIPFSVLADGPYLDVASWLDAPDLARMDAVCQLTLVLNTQPSGPWHNLGSTAFFGMELDERTGFVQFSGQPGQVRQQKEALHSKWKKKYLSFHNETHKFSAPYNKVNGGGEISNVERADEVAYCRCRLRTDVLATRDDCGAYVEIEVRANADNLSLAVVDFESGGRSSVTFSPETGAVLRERKVNETPRAIEGAYIHLLPAAPPGHRFEGLMGLYFQGGQLAFFRKWSEAAAPRDGAADAEGENAGATLPASVVPSWETTGFCTDLRWAFGQRLSLCLAFRDAGRYDVRIVRVCRTPPVAVQKSAVAYQDSAWNLLYGDDDHPLAI